MSVLELNHVKKSFNNGTLHVLKDISLSVEKGEVVADTSAGLRDKLVAPSEVEVAR